MLDTYMILALAAGTLVVGGFLLMNTRDDDRETIVGVQRKGRTYFVRRGALDRPDTWSYSSSTRQSWDRTHLSLWIVVALLLLTLLGTARIA